MEHHARSAPPARLRRGAGVLIGIFWSAHFSLMWVRAEISNLDDRGLLESTLSRLAFALFGAFVSYILYRCLRPLRLRGFARQAAIGAVLASVAAFVQAAVNTFAFGDSRHLLNSFIFFSLYWFWF